MGLFAAVADFAHGGPALSVTLERSQCHWGETLRGAVEVQGGAKEQTIRRLAVRVVEHADGGKDFSSWNPHEAVEIGSEIGVAPGTRPSFPFVLRLPEAGNPSAGGSVVRFLWSVEAEAHFAHILGVRTALADFDLQYPLLSDALQALRDAVSVAAPLRLRSEARHGSRVIFQFAPLPEAASALDGVVLTAEEVGQEVIGILQVNPQEHSLTDLARALVHGDLAEYAVTFPTAVLRASSGGLVAAEVVDSLKRRLAPFLERKTR